MVFAYTLILSSILAFSQSQTDRRAEICGSENPEQAILDIYQVRPLYDQMVLLFEAEENGPLQPLQSHFLKRTLGRAFENYLGQRRANRKLSRLYLLLPPHQRSEFAGVMNSYVRSYKRAKDSLEREMTESSEKPEHKYSYREARVSEIKQHLQAIHKVEANRILSEADQLTALDKKFLEKWSFELATGGPRYVWSEGAEFFHKYLWWLMARVPELKSSGRFARGAYWIETNLLLRNPGLSMNVTARSPITPAEDANIQISFSPFSDRLNVKFCRFEERPDFCVAEDVDQWCARKTR